MNKKTRTIVTVILFLAAVLLAWKLYGGNLVGQTHTVEQRVLEGTNNPTPYTDAEFVDTGEEVCVSGKTTPNGGAGGVVTRKGQGPYVTRDSKCCPKEPVLGVKLPPNCKPGSLIEYFCVGGKVYRVATPCSKGICDDNTNACANGLKSGYPKKKPTKTTPWYRRIWPF